MTDVLPLTGLKVLDFTRLLPGAYATLVLADMGAQVDKVEDPRGGDPLRHYAPRFRDCSAFFYALGRNKRSLALDLKRPDVLTAVRRLVRHYDVVVESFRPGVMQRLGLSYEALSAEHPALIYCSITGFGQTGPDSLRAGHDLGFLARAGVLGTTGEKGGPPAMSGGQFADVGGGSLFALSGILAALYAKERTGRGRHLDVSMTEGSLAFIHMHLGAQLLTGGEPTLARGAGPLNGGHPCYGLYRTLDGRYLAVGAVEPKFFEGVCEVLGLPELAQSGWARDADAQKVRAALSQRFEQETLAFWMGRFREKDVCVEPVLEGDELFADAQHCARRVVVEEPVGLDAEPLKQLRTPLSPQAQVTRLEPPALGAHSRDILREAGFSDEALAQLLSSVA